MWVFSPRKFRPSLWMSLDENKTKHCIRLSGFVHNCTTLKYLDKPDQRHGSWALEHFCHASSASSSLQRLSFWSCCQFQTPIFQAHLPPLPPPLPSDPSATRSTVRSPWSQSLLLDRCAKARSNTSERLSVAGAPSCGRGRRSCGFNVLLLISQAPCSTPYIYIYYNIIIAVCMYLTSCN